MVVLRKCAIFVQVVALLALADLAAAGSSAFPEGTYEIVSRLELPHVERWAVELTTRVCLPGKPGAGAIPIPVLSANNPFGKCAAANLNTDGASIAYDIVCPGRASAKAHARYAFEPGGFNGRVEMVMAAKNMTMTEVVSARRLGACERQNQDAAVVSGALATTH